MASDNIVLELLLAPMSLGELCNEAEWIIGGAVTKVFPGTISEDVATGRPIVYTDVEIKVADRYKGTLSHDTIVVRSLGGQAPELSMSVSGAPSFAPREAVILFLSKDSGNYFPLEGDKEFVVHGWERGKYSVRGDIAMTATEPESIELQKLKEIIKEHSG